MTAHGVSIVICCYNSASRLSPTLEHIWRQRPLHDEQPIELILVDNCCTDDTVATVRAHHMAAHERHISVNVIEEPKPGLTNARIAGITAAKYSTLIFCDDDNWLAPDYAHNAHLLLMDHPDVGIAGGCSLGEFECKPPAWFESICGAWAIGESDYKGYLNTPGATVRGAGLVLRRQAFEELRNSGFEFMTSDRKGATLTSGGDSELCIALSHIGYEQFFDCSLVLTHWIPSERLNWKYALRLWQGFGAASILAEPSRICAMPLQKLRNRVRTSFVYQLLRNTFGVVMMFHFHSWFHADGLTKPLQLSSQIGRLTAVWKMGPSYRRIILKRVNWLNRNQLR